MLNSSTKMRLQKSQKFRGSQNSDNAIFKFTAQDELKFEEKR